MIFLVAEWYWTAISDSLSHLLLMLHILLSFLPFVFNLDYKNEEAISQVYFLFLPIYGVLLLSLLILLVRVFYFLSRTHFQEKKDSDLQLCLNTKPTSCYYLHCHLPSWQTEFHCCKYLLWISIVQVKLQKQPFPSHDEKHTPCSSKPKKDNFSDLLLHRPTDLTFQNCLEIRGEEESCCISKFCLPVSTASVFLNWLFFAVLGKAHIDVAHIKQQHWQLFFLVLVPQTLPCKMIKFPLQMFENNCPPQKLILGI